jgi:uncharacterized membrane protein YjfL (UPF0719 family)
MRLRRAGDICRSMETHGNVLGVSGPSFGGLQRQTSTVSSRANFAVVDFAMTEAAYTVVRLLQRFPVLEKPDDEVEVRTGKEQQTMTLVLAITNGCRVRFAN